MKEAQQPKKMPYILILKTGPTHKLTDHIEFQAEALSKRASGEFWTHGPNRLEMKAGNFIIDCEAVEENLKGKLRYMFRRIKRGVELVRRERGNVVVISYDPFRSGLMGLAIRMFTGARFICEVNGVYGERENLIDWGTNWRSTFKFNIMKAVANFVIKRADGVRLLYKEQLNGLTQKVPSSKIRCYFDAVPLDRFVDLGSEKFVLSVGYPFLRKGVDVLLKAFEGLQDEFPDWTLVIIGHEMPEKVAAAKPNIRKLNVLRGMTNDQIANWIGRTGIFVLASRSEAMGRVLIETAAAKKPRISTRVGGTYTVLKDGTDGIMIPPGDVGALQGALRKLMGSEALRRELGEAGHKTAYELFSPQAYCDSVCGFVEYIQSQN
jgi:glycosyltransferase involved in cell wall biosynthesis